MQFVSNLNITTFIPISTCEECGKDNSSLLLSTWMGNVNYSLERAFPRIWINSLKYGLIKYE